MRFISWVVTLLAGIMAAVYFNSLNPDPITLRFSRDSATDVTPIYLVLVCLASGALAIVLMAGVREIHALILNWRASRLRKREERVQGYYADGVRAALSRRAAEAIALFQKVLALEPHHLRALLALGNLFRREKNYQEAIRLHRKARSLEEGNLEVLLSLARDLEEAKRFEEAIQTLEEVLKLDSTNPTGLYRLRDIYIRTGKWPTAHGIQERLLKAGLPERDKQGEIQIMAGLKYEVGQAYLSRGERDQARRFFKDAIKLDKGFLPARIGFGELLVHEGKLRQAAETWEKSYQKTGNPIFLQRLEDLYLEMGEPGEMLRIYQDALSHKQQDPYLKLALGKLYYRLEMIDDAFDLLSTLEGVHDSTGDLNKVMVSLYIRKGNTEAALLEVLTECRPGAAVLHCVACQTQTREWSGRCPLCSRWNTLAVLAPIAVASSMPPDSRPDAAPAPSYPGAAAPFEIV